MNTKFYTTILLLLVASQAVMGACNTDALNNLLTSANAQHKENEEEEDYATINVLSTVATTGFTADGVCGKIWTDAEGTCCAQDEIKTRADTLVKKLVKRMSQRWKVLRKGNDKALKSIAKIEEQIAKRETNMKGKGTTQETIDAWKATLLLLKGENSKVEAKNTAAIEKMKTCIKEIAETRVKTWCLACANMGGTTLDTTQFFTNGVINVQQPTCETLIDKCADVFAYFRKVRAADRIMRKFRKALTGKDKGKAKSDIEANDDTVLTSDSTCTDDLAGCKSDTTKRQGMCSSFGLNKDQDKNWGDGAMLENTADDLPTERRLLAFNSKLDRILATDTSAGTANESTTGINVTGLSGGF